MRLLALSALLEVREDALDERRVLDAGNNLQFPATAPARLDLDREQILRALMEESIFGSQFQRAQQLLTGMTDPVALVELTAHVSPAIYESESSNLGLLRHASGPSPALRKIEQEFEHVRYEM